MEKVFYKKLLWGDNVFEYLHKKNRVIIGRDIMTKCLSNGRKKLMEGTCMIFRAKNLGLLKSSMVLRRKILNIVLYVDFPLYLTSAINYKIVKFSYSRKIISSRLSLARFKT